MGHGDCCIEHKSLVQWHEWWALVYMHVYLRLCSGCRSTCSWETCLWSRCKVSYTMTCTSLFGIDVRIAGKLPYPNGSNIQSRWYTNMQLVLQLYLPRDAGAIDVYEDHVRSGLRGRSGPISGHLCKWYLCVRMKAWRHFKLSMISAYQVQYALAELNHYSS